MDPAFWGVAVVLVVGIGLVGYGWLSDRRKAREYFAALAAPPERTIPGFHPDVRPPEYLSELQAVTRADGAGRTDLSDARRTALDARLSSATPFAAPWTRAEFATDAPGKRAVLEHPLILIVDDEVTTVRELLLPLEAAKQSDRPLVLVAPAIDEVVSDTLRANKLQRMLACVAVTLPDDKARAALAETVGAMIVTHGDLQSGWLPPEAFGTCDTWVSDAKRSWVLPTPGPDATG